MKCIIKNGMIKRVSENSVNELIKAGWGYCTKSDYKTFLKNGGVPVPTKEVEVKVKKTKKVEVI